MSKHVFLNKTTHCNFATKQPNCTKPRYIFQGSCTFAKSPTLGELHPPFLLYKLELQKIAAVWQHLAVCCSYMYKYYIYIFVSYICVSIHIILYIIDVYMYIYIFYMNQNSVRHLLAKDLLAMATIWNSAPKASTNNLAENTWLEKGAKTKTKDVVGRSMSMIPLSLEYLPILMKVIRLIHVILGYFSKISSTANILGTQGLSVFVTVSAPTEKKT